MAKGITNDMLTSLLLKLFIRKRHATYVKTSSDVLYHTKSVVVKLNFFSKMINSTTSSSFKLAKGKKNCITEETNNITLLLFKHLELSGYYMYHHV